MIILERAYLPDNSATLGKWTMSGVTCYTMENPWKGNKVGESCIPEGVYRMALRESPIVERTSGGEYKEGWEILDVPGRSLIMVHPGNWEDDTQGCILPGKAFFWDGNGPMVTHSRNTFSKIMGFLRARNEWEIDIRAKTAAYP